MFSYDNTQGFSEDEIERMNKKLVFRCARAGISPRGLADEKERYDAICTKILEEAF